MAKDPALLWYWGDWFSGTATFTRHQKGCYMDLLHAQFNNGHLSLEEIRTVLGNDFAAWQGSLSKKFAVDETGKYFNERLDLEKSKRQNYTASRRENFIKNKASPHMEPHMHHHMEPHMDNEDDNENKNKNGKRGVGKKPKIKPLKISIPLPYTSENFLSVWNTLTAEKNWKKKSVSALTVCAHQLSKYNEPTAIQMMLNTIAGGWQGLFEIKNSTNGKFTSQTKSGSSTSISDELRRRRNENLTPTG